MPVTVHHSLFTHGVGDGSLRLCPWVCCLYVCVLVEEGAMVMASLFGEFGNTSRVVELVSCGSCAHSNTVSVINTFSRETYICFVQRDN